MGKESLSVDRLYTEFCATIRATDEISFKLMGLVPLATGATGLALFLGEAQLTGKESLVVSLALLAALATLGLFRWELRNIQTCNWLRRRAEKLEEAYGPRCVAVGLTGPPSRIGKTEATKAIYCITILGWLMLP